MVGHEQKNLLPGFFGITYALTLSSWGVMAIFGIHGPALETGSDASALGLVLMMIGGFAPSIAGIVMVRVAQGPGAIRTLLRRGVRLGLGTRWYLAIIAIFVAAQGAVILRILVVGGELLWPGYLGRPLFLLGNIPALLLLGPISEEFGWRGFALDRMLARWSRPVTNLVLGLAWALWHLPLFFIPGTSQSQFGQPFVSFGIFTVQLIALTVIYTWIYLKTGRNLWSAIFLHFMTAFVAFIASGFIPGVASFIDLAAVGTYVVIAAAITIVVDLKQAPPG